VTRSVYQRSPAGPNRDAYIECLRHVGVWEGRIKKIERMRSYHPNPADNHDYPKPETEEQSALAAA
jgi:hypothetical protein